MKIIKVRRGDIYYINGNTFVFGDKKKNRPAIIVSQDNTHKVVDVIYTTTQQPDPYRDIHVTVMARQLSAAVCDEIYTIPKYKLGGYIGHVTQEEQEQIDQALSTALGIGKDEAMKKIEQTLTSMEVAEMVGKQHKNLMRDIGNYLNEFNRLNFEPVDFFRESTYVDGKGEVRPCYQITKKGCEFVAHKLIGIKGTEFTAKYIDRFHEMEEVIQHKTAIDTDELKIKSIEAKLMNARARVANTFLKIANIGDIDPVFKNMLAAKASEALSGENLMPTPKVEIEKLYDKTEMAKELGIYSAGGNPHAGAVGAIISHLQILESETVNTPFTRNGHSGITTQYKPSVLDKVEKWLIDRKYPASIYGDKKYAVTYYGKKGEYDDKSKAHST